MAVTLLFTGYYRHPKMVRANNVSGGELAEVLWSRGLDYVNEHGTDGFIPTGAPEILCPTKTAARIKGLVAAGLWVEVDGGWAYHDYTDWNRRQAELNELAKAKSEAKSRAGKKGAAVRWGKRLHRPEDGTTDGTANGSTHGTAIAGACQSDNPGPGPGPVGTSLRSVPLSPTGGKPPATTAQELLAEHIDGCRSRPPQRVVGHLGKQVKTLLGEGIDPAHVRGGLRIVRDRGLDPASLPSAVNQVMNPPADSAPARRAGAVRFDPAAQDYTNVRI